MDAEKFIERVEADLRMQAAAELLQRSLWDAVWKQRLELEELFQRESGPGA